MAAFSTILGSYYIGTTVICLFGVCAAASVRHLFLSHSGQNSHTTVQRRLALIRIFPGLTAVATVIILATSFVRTILHSTLKVRICATVSSFRLIAIQDALITECIALATGQNVDIVLGIWGSNPGHNLTPSEANQCVSFRRFPGASPQP